MKVIQQFQADDGSRWDTAADALKRDEVVRACKAAVAVLKTPFGDHRKGYVQQDHDDVLACKTQLLCIAERVGVYKAAEAAADPAAVHNQGMMGRFIEDAGCEPLRLAWFRVMCTDDQDREWEQPAYATVSTTINPGTGPNSSRRSTQSRLDCRLPGSTGKTESR